MSGGPQLTTRSGSQKCSVRCHDTQVQKAPEEVRQAVMPSRKTNTCILICTIWRNPVTTVKGQLASREVWRTARKDWMTAGKSAPGVEG